MKTTQEIIAQAEELIDRLEPQVLVGSQRQYISNMMVVMWGWGAADARAADQSETVHDMQEQLDSVLNAATLAGVSFEDIAKVLEQAALNFRCSVQEGRVNEPHPY